MALLADRLVEAAANYKAIPQLSSDFRYIAAKIRDAQRFSVSDDVRGAIRSLLTSRPSTLLEAARFARLPFDRCWFEWVAPHDAKIHPGQVQVRGCGALMENWGPHGFTMFTAWEYDAKSKRADIEAQIDKLAGGRYDLIDDSAMPNFGVSSLVGRYDFSGLIGAPAPESDSRFRWFQQKPLTREDLKIQRDDERNPVRHAMKSEKEWEALTALSQSASFRVHDEVHGYQKITDQQMLTGDIGSIIHDVQDEMGHLFATLILMNSKNCVKLAPTEPEAKLNKARRKRGKPELLPYSTVRIELTKSQERAVQGGLISREEARRHLVRGHFKVRASGVFWWGDFWRGNALKGIVERKAHVIEMGTGVV
jgi:hypothetical protein